MAYEIVRMKPEHAPEVARLHYEGIVKGFITTLGTGFLADLYRAIGRSSTGFVLAGVDEQGVVRGYVSGTTTVSGLYRSVLLRRGWLYVGMLARHVLSFRTLRRIVESILYPARIPKDLPDAELLSIVVSPESRGSGLAGELLDALLAEFRSRGCERFRVLVRADLERANAYYVKHGFILAHTLESHGVLSNIYVLNVERHE